MAIKFQYIKSIFLIFWICISYFNHGISQNSIYRDVKIKGITMVSPPKPFTNNPVQKLAETNSNWIAITPFGFSASKGIQIEYNQKNHWWGLQNEGLEEIIRLAKEEGLKIMMKPQIFIEDDWVGDLDFPTENEWLGWEQNYSEFILNYAKLAESFGVELFCIGTEVRNSVMNRKEFWFTLIERIRSVYKGKLVYASNWDTYDEVLIWDAVDYIGISAYFPLSKSKTPDQRTLLKKWRPVKRKLKALSSKYSKQILFTEFGYLSVDGCAYKAWELEDKIELRSQNQEAQANALDALFMTFWTEEFWAGGFLWKWFPNMKGHEGYPELDYTPQGKIAERIVQKWYRRNMKKIVSTPSNYMKL